MEIEIRHATEAHAEALAAVLREQDAEEGRALGLDPRQGLLDSVRKSDVTYAVFFGGEIASIFGVLESPGTALAGADTGTVWMLSGRACTKHPREFLRTSRLIVDFLLRKYRLLTNVIDARYAGALRWAKWLGFEVGEPEPFGPFQLPFCRFVVRRS